MTRTQYNTAVSLDGFIADESDSLEWLLALDNEAVETTIFTTFMEGVGAQVMGATTYRWLIDHEDLVAHPERWQDYYGGIPTWVFTHGPLPVVDGADVRFVAGDVAKQHRAMLRSAGGKNLWIVGGGPLAAQFAEAGLLDDVILSLAPVTLGAGKSVLPARLEGVLRLAAVERAGQFVALRYEVVRERPGAVGPVVGGAAGETAAGGSAAGGPAGGGSAGGGSGLEFDGPPEAG